MSPVDDVHLPHNLEAERSTLGAALVDVKAADYIIDNLVPDDYFRRAHGTMFEAVRKLREKGVVPDFVSLKDAIPQQKLDDVGGPAYISGLADGLPRSTNVPYYCRILKDLRTRRQLIMAGRETILEAGDGELSVDEMLVAADRRITDILVRQVDSRMQSLAESSGDLFKDLEYRVEHKGQLTGLDTGYPTINELTLGWQPGDLIIVAARPSIGKTAFVLNTAVHASQGPRAKRREGAVRVAFFSLEMRRRQLEYRLLSSLSGVQLSRLMGGYLAKMDYDRIAPAMELMHGLQIEIDDRAGQTAVDIRGACRRLKAEGGLDLIVVDYVQLMPGTLERKGTTRNEEITDISRRLKDLADECDAPVILLSQLRRIDGVPKLDDLRESGSLEQAADIVLLLHRKNHAESGATKGILAKQRNGPTGSVPLMLDRDTTTFVETTPEQQAALQEADEQEQPADEGKRRQKGYFARRYGGGQE